MSDTPNPPDTTPPTTAGRHRSDDPSLSVQPIALQDEMERSFLDYAMSVIMSRALPDVRDGLKPVHRRIIWDMDEQGFRPDRPFVKSARVTGDTMAKYHPHGDSAIYDALVRMAQPFSLRHPLIDFHGNYGSPDFGPAAARYTECRLHPLAMQMLADIDEEHRRHACRPTTAAARSRRCCRRASPTCWSTAARASRSAWPPTSRRTTSARSSTPPSTCIDHPEATPDDLMQFVKGPDFPTGGSILGRAGIMDAYRTGRGSIKMRATAAIEEGKRGQMQIVVTELPVPDQLLGHRRPHPGTRRRRRARRHRRRQRRIRRRQDQPGHHAQARRQRQRGAQQPVQAHPAADQLRRQHGGAGRRRAAHAQPGARRCRATSATRSRSSPVVPSSASTRRTSASTSSKGRIKALNVIDQIIALIRASDDAAAAKVGLMAPPFEFSEMQATDILEMRLVAAHPTQPHRLETEMQRRAGAHHRAAEHPRRPREAAWRHQDRDDRDQGRVRHAARVPDRPRHGRDEHRGPRRRQGTRHRDDRGAVREGRHRPAASRPRAAAAAASAAPS